MFSISKLGSLYFSIRLTRSIALAKMKQPREEEVVHFALLPFCLLLVVFIFISFYFSYFIASVLYIILDCMFCFIFFH